MLKRHDHHVRQDLINFLARFEVKSAADDVVYYSPNRWTLTDTITMKVVDTVCNTLEKACNLLDRMRI